MMINEMEKMRGIIAVNGGEWQQMSYLRSNSA